MLKMLKGAASNPRQPAQHAVEVAGIGPHQDDVGERGEVGRRDVGERDERVHDMAQRHVAACGGPGQRHAQRDAQQPGAARELQAY